MITRNDITYVTNFFEPFVDSMRPFRESARLVGKYWKCGGKSISNPNRIFSIKRFFPYNGLNAGGCATNVSANADPSFFKAALECLFPKDCVVTMRVEVVRNAYYGIKGGYEVTIST